MIRLVCTKCGKVWYTADMRGGQKCDDCKGDLINTELYEQEKPCNTIQLNSANIGKLTQAEKS